MSALRRIGKVTGEVGDALAGLDFGAAHAHRVALVVKHAKRETPDPKHIALFGAQGIVPDTNDLADAIEPLRVTGRGGVAGTGLVEEDMASMAKPPCKNDAKRLMAQQATATGRSVNQVAPPS